MADTSLIAKLRQRIKDTRFARRAIGLSVVSEGVTKSIAEVTGGHLVVTVFGGSAPSVDFNFGDVRYNTVLKLKEALDRTDGYEAVLDEDAEVEHSTVELEPFGPTDIMGRSVDLKHHIFSDIELESILQDAVSRHNPSFEVKSVPLSEYVFVLQLAHAQICRIQAYDTAKRKGLDTDTGSLLSIAQDLEKNYNDDTKRLRRAIVSPKEATPNTMQQGDIVIGSQFKRNLRTGYMAPMSANIPPSAAILREPDIRDIEDDNIRITWERNKDYDFYSCELWMDTRPDVRRVNTTDFTPTVVPASVRPSGPNRDVGERQTTSKMVFRSFGANSNFDNAAFSTFVEEFGQLIASYVEPNVEPETVYYARLYMVDLNYETVASKVMEYKTLPVRTRLDRSNTVSPSYGPKDTIVTTKFRTDRGQFTENHKLTLGGKPVEVTSIVDPFTVTWKVPAFFSDSTEAKDLVVESPTKLVDKYEYAFRVTS